MISNAPEDPADTRKKGTDLTILAGCGALVLGVLVVTLVFSFFYSMFHAPVLSTLYHAEGLTSFFVNLVVVFYAFPAFKRTKNRALLCIGFAALSFAYRALFNLLLGVRPPATAWHVAHMEAQWYYATQYTATIVGLVLYAYGVVSLIRSGIKTKV
jgi:hypothetical protein